MDDVRQPKPSLDESAISYHIEGIENKIQTIFQFLCLAVLK